MFKKNFNYARTLCIQAMSSSLITLYVYNINQLKLLKNKEQGMTHFMIQHLYMCIVATVISINKNCKMPYMPLNKVI